MEISREAFIIFRLEKQAKYSVNMMNCVHLCQVVEDTFQQS
jgi:hypothetical protein